jgi:hypothetical protein
MPIKKAIPPRRAAPRRARASTAADKAAPIATPEPESYASGTLLSREEKRQIILAHAAVRKPTDTVQVTSMWLGVAACAVVVAIGWWWAVKPEIVGRLSQGLTPALAESRKVASEVSDSLSGLTTGDTFKPLSDSAEDKMNLIKQQAVIESKAKQELTKTLTDQSDGAASGTRDLFSPGLVVTGTPAVQTEKTTETSKP